ncbi:MAG: 50S ribosomal protein L25 [Dehalococcoidia bacterium]
MADRIQVAAAPRTVLGKQVRQLRREGKLPANVFGRGIDSVAIELDARDFQRTIRGSAIRTMMDLQIEGEAAARPVVIRSISREGGTGPATHVDFYQVDPQRPISATLPLKLIGEAPAVRDLAGVLVQVLEQVHVKCLPLTMPEYIEVDLSSLVSFAAGLPVGKLVPPPDVEILTDASAVVVSVAPPRAARPR